MELALQEYLQRGTIGICKDDAIEYVTSDGDVQFHWCCLMSTVTEECAQELLKVVVQLLVTVRGFSLAAAYRRSGFNCKYLLIANCEFFYISQLIDSQT